MRGHRRGRAGARHQGAALRCAALCCAMLDYAALYCVLTWCAGVRFIMPHRTLCHAVLRSLSAGALTGNAVALRLLSRRAAPFMCDYWERTAPASGSKLTTPRSEGLAPTAQHTAAGPDCLRPQAQQDHHRARHRGRGAGALRALRAAAALTISGSCPFPTFSRAR